MRRELISNVLGDRWSDLNNSRLFIILVIIFYVLVAHFSTGYYHWDEHYQIIEFANYKLGKTDAANLAWEFNAGIRPTFQPWLCYYFVDISKAEFEPYAWYGVDRLTSWSVDFFQEYYGIPFNQSDALWRSFEDKIEAYVNNHQGSAVVGNEQIFRPDWHHVKDVLEGRAPLSTLSTDCPD